MKSAASSWSAQLSKLNSLIKPKLGCRYGPRPPVVTIMGHVDHGKTTILDALRRSEITKYEHGGITQHIGAFVVALDDASKSSHGKTRKSSLIRSDCRNLVTFLDTPGHAAFHAMRQRGANITDIVVLVVAADDGVLDQTVESIKYAQNANVPIVVAVNKIDKVDIDDPAHLERISSQLNVHGIITEDAGGDTQMVKISALAGIGLDDLKESIVALAEASEIKSPLDGDATGYVIESCLDQARGRLATILVKTGTLKKGTFIVSHSDASYCYAKIRSMFDEFGNVVDSVPPGFPIQIIGWKDGDLPDAGDEIVQVANESIAKEYIQGRKRLSQLLQSVDDVKAAVERDKYLTEMYQEHVKSKLEGAQKNPGTKYRKMRVSHDVLKIDKENDQPKLNLIIKADVNGSVEAILDVLETYPNDREPLKLDIVHYGVGPVTQSEIELAALFPNTHVYTFNLPPNLNSAAKLRKLGVPLKPFNVIYHLMEDLMQSIAQSMPVVDHQDVQGELTVVQEFLINEKHKKVPVAGSRCISGEIKKGPEYLFKIIRNGMELVYDVPIVSLRFEKSEVNTIAKGSDCGLRLDVSQATVSPQWLAMDPTFDSSSFHFLPGDKLINYCYKKVKLKCKWSPKGF